jgi:uncharacterized protein (DUF1499 family)
MRTSIIVIVIIIFFLLVFVKSMIFSKPKELGVKDGKLEPCPNSPNCISTQADSNDKEHFMIPLSYTTSRDEAKQKIIDIIKNLPRTKIITEKEDYIHSTFTSRLMHYVDDVEFYFDDKAKLIHFRSASRVGYSDMGVNKARMEEITKLFYGK